ncbi:MAG: hypothetical protein IIW02_00660 [Clostridia bacterium]|nr:hypothetical protein [Clostridia bacterium]
MDRDPNLQNEQNTSEQLPEKKPLYTYQRIKAEGSGFKRRENKRNGIKDSDRQLGFTFSLPKIEKDQQGKFFVTAVAVLLFVANLVALARLCSNLMYTIADKLLLLLRFDSIHFEKFTFMNMRILTTYILSFFVGGFVVYVLLKILSVFSENGIIFQVGHVIRLIISFILLVFAFISLIKLLFGAGMYSYEMLNTMAPASMCICSIIICLFSKQNILMD